MKSMNFRGQLTPITFSLPLEVHPILSLSIVFEVCIHAGMAGEGVGAVDLISFKNQKLDVITSISAHNCNCTSIRIDPEFRKMAIGSMDFLVSLWDLDDLICHHTINLE